MYVTANKRFYDALSGDDAVMVENNLFGAEKAILSSIKDEIRDKAILEIGVGSGRLTHHVRALSKHYVGIDRSEAMIGIVKAAHPDAQLFICDATNMTTFKTGVFDAVFFFWNGIDEVRNSGRIRILNEVQRLLKAQGVFVFSSHNLDWQGIPSYAFPCLSRSSDPLIFILDSLLRVVAYATTVLKYVFSKLTSQPIALWEYEKSPRGMLVPRLYIRHQIQLRQLHQAGFQQVKALASDGTALTARNLNKDYFIYYIARKNGPVDGAQ